MASKVRRYAAMPLTVSVTNTAGAFAAAIVSPASGASLTQGTPVIVSITTTAPASSVDFYSAGAFVGSATGLGTSWSYSWTPGSAGTIAITASAVASANAAVTVSPAVSVSVAAAPATAGNFGALFTGVLQYLRSDLGRTLAGSDVTAWADQSGNGRNVTPATGSTAIGTVTAGLNGRAGILSDGSTHGGQFTLDMGVPGTTPIFYWALWRLLSAPSTPSVLLGDGSGRAGVSVNVGTTNCYINCGGTLGPVTTPVGTWGRLEVKFSDQTSDYIRFRSSVTADNGFSAGNADPLATRGLFSQPAGTSKIGAEMLALVTLNNVPTAPQLAAALAEAASFYAYASFG